jgi:hypothetical protein
MPHVCKSAPGKLHQASAGRGSYGIISSTPNAINSWSAEKSEA